MTKAPNPNLRGSLHCVINRSPSLRPEIESAIAQMATTGAEYAYVVCRTWDDLAWEVTTKEGGIYSATSDRYARRGDAIAAGEAWLRDRLA